MEIKKEDLEFDRQMSLNLHKNSKSEFLYYHNNCAFCGNDLKLKYQLKVGHYVIVEEGYCMICEIRTRAQEHPLH